MYSPHALLWEGDILMIVGVFGVIDQARPEGWEEVVSGAAKQFLENARVFKDDDRAILDLSIQSYDHLAATDLENKLRRVMDYLEISLLKCKQPFSNGLLFSLCIVALISRAFAENLQRHLRDSLARDDTNARLKFKLAEERASALVALFGLIKFSSRKEANPLMPVYKAAGKEPDIGKVVLPASIPISLHYVDSNTYFP